MLHWPGPDDADEAAPPSESERFLEEVGVCLSLDGGPPEVELLPEGPLRFRLDDEGLCCDLGQPPSKYDPECACEWLPPWLAL